MNSVPDIRYALVGGLMNLTASAKQPGTTVAGPYRFLLPWCTGHFALYHNRELVGGHLMVVTD